MSFNFLDLDGSFSSFLDSIMWTPFILPEVTGYGQSSAPEQETKEPSQVGTAVAWCFHPNFCWRPGLMIHILSEPNALSSTVPSLDFPVGGSYWVATCFTWLVASDSTGLIHGHVKGPFYLFQRRVKWYKLKNPLSWQSLSHRRVQTGGKSTISLLLKKGEKLARHTLLHGRDPQETMMDWIMHPLWLWIRQLWSKSVD